MLHLLPNEIVLIIAKMLLYEEHRPHLKPRTRIAVKDFNQISPNNFLFDFANTSKTLQRIVGSFLYKNISVGPDVMSQFENYSVAHTSILNRDKRPVFYLCWKDALFATPPCHALKLVQHLFISVTRRALNLLTLVNQEEMPFLADLSLSFGNKNYPFRNIDRVRVAIDGYNYPVKIHLAVKVTAYSTGLVSDILQLNGPSLESHRVKSLQIIIALPLVNHTSSISKTIISPCCYLVASLKGLKKLVFSGERFTDNFFSGEFGFPECIEHLEHLKELEVSFPGAQMVERIIRAPNLAPNIKYLKISTEFFQKLSCSRLSFDSITHLELNDESTRHIEYQKDCAFKKIKSLFIHKFNVATLHVVFRILTDNPDLITIGFRDIDLHDLGDVLPHLAFIQHLEFMDCAWFSLKNMNTHQLSFQGEPLPLEEALLLSISRACPALQTLYYPVPKYSEITWKSCIWMLRNMLLRRLKTLELYDMPWDEDENYSQYFADRLFQHRPKFLFQEDFINEENYSQEVFTYGRKTTDVFSKIYQVAELLSDYSYCKLEGDERAEEEEDDDGEYIPGEDVGDEGEDISDGDDDDDDYGEYISW